MFGAGSLLSVIWGTNAIYDTDTPVQLFLNLTYALHIC